MTPYYSKDGIVIYCGDNAEIMKSWDAGSIDLAVTSPPYDKVDYDEAGNLITHFDKGLRTYNGYSWDFPAVSGQLWRVTAQGGVVVWVVADATVNGSETGTSFRQALGFMGLGFNLYQTMHYHKDGPPPQDDKYEKVTEYMFILSKSKPKSINLIRDKTNRWAGTSNWGQKTIREKDGRLTTRKPIVVNDTGKRTTIWRYSSGGTDTGHPAPFPEALARDHIISWSNEGDLVCDPFLGSGTTAKMAQQLGRRFVGCDVSEEYCRIAVDRLRQPSYWSVPTMQEKPPKPEQFALNLTEIGG